jgi:hypothetical protein
VPAGTRTVQPARLRRSFVASAPRGQRNVTRMPAVRLRPRSWIWRPVGTRTALRQAAVEAGMQRRPVSRGGPLRACAAGTAVSANAAVRAQRAAAAARASVIVLETGRGRGSSDVRVGRGARGAAATVYQR